MAKEELTSAIHDPLGAILGTRAKVAALRVLSQATDALPYREVVRRSGMAYNSIAPAIAELTAVGLLDELKAGRERRVRIAPLHRLTPALLQLLHAERDFFPALRMELRHVAAAALGDGLLSAALIGNVAHGGERLGEHVEVLLIARDAAATVRCVQRFERLADSLLLHFGVTLALRSYDLGRAQVMWRTRTAAAHTAVSGALLLGGDAPDVLLDV